MGKGGYSEDKACAAEAVVCSELGLGLDDELGDLNNLKMHNNSSQGWDTPRMSLLRGNPQPGQMLLNFDSPCNSIKRDSLGDISLDIAHAPSHWDNNYQRFLGGATTSPAGAGKEGFFGVGAHQDKFHNLGYGDNDGELGQLAAHPAPSVAIDMVPPSKKRKTEGFEPNTTSEFDTLIFASGMSTLEQGCNTSVEHQSVSGLPNVEMSSAEAKAVEEADKSGKASQVKDEDEEESKPHSEATEQALQSMGLSRRGLLKIPQAIQVLASEGQVLKANGDGSYTVLNGSRFEEEFNSLRVTRLKKNDGAKDRPFSRMSKHFELLQGEKWARTGSVFVPRARRGNDNSSAPSPVQESLSAPSSSGTIPIPLPPPRSASAPESKPRPPPLDSGNINLATANIHASRINIDLKDENGRPITCTLQQFLDVTGAAEIYKRALTVRHGRSNMGVPAAGAQQQQK
mmetsp:Transcript_48736/g.76095  ORF Transcript_48736/g.76095 Transcript_48736/m.76095 type:complete len:457 (+) Transcript_48736:485-1855(+)|eukprot:CAMPEP_0184312594 /NCGR_PEP_ID=MMETSP1049-20130417/50697_1 /TAXON_ID=77928 /ORGANISM="Proteomonas sulcata, Strain CCMP704" /LENGTH=456 /DNA_ID=CAMNT_0026628855 /DNA_START=485 /DNA_END=1855 /DNA_ORIENTATION=+